MFSRRQRKPNVAELAVAELRALASDRLPDAYFAFLLAHPEGGSFLLPDAMRFVLWPPAEVLELNQRFDVGDNYPRLFAFGSNGAQSMYAFDLRREPPAPVVMLPFIGVIDELRRLAPDFAGFCLLLTPAGPAAR